VYSEQSGAFSEALEAHSEENEMQQQLLLSLLLSHNFLRATQQHTHLFAQRPATVQSEKISRSRRCQSFLSSPSFSASIWDFFRYPAR